MALEELENVIVGASGGVAFVPFTSSQNTAHSRFASCAFAAVALHG
ncbi:MAG TPA: hypothetical protein VI565_00955 [Burkholderiales bacterium]|nr:hypothetical protein [Burkholderiales bacterium]